MGRTVRVNCDRGGSLTDAIARAERDPIVVQVSGTCSESVRVERARVTILGVAPGAIIRPPRVDGQPVGPGILARGADGLVLQDLTVQEATDGIVVIDSRGVVLTRVTSILNNGPGLFFDEGMGAIFDNSEAAVTASDLSRNQAPVMSNRGSSVTVSGSKLNDNSIDGPFSINLSILGISQSEMTGNGLCPQAIFHSLTSVRGSTVSCAQDSFAIEDSRVSYTNSTVSAGADVIVQQNSVVTFSRTPVTTPFVFVTSGSTLEILGSTLDLVGDPDASAIVFAHSYLRSRVSSLPDGTIVRSNVHGPVGLDEFSDGYLTTADPIDSVFCAERSRVLLNHPPTNGTFGCE